MKHEDTAHLIALSKIIKSAIDESNFTTIADSFAMDIINGSWDSAISNAALSLGNNELLECSDLGKDYILGNLLSPFLLTSNKLELLQKIELLFNEYFREGAITLFMSEQNEVLCDFCKKLSDEFEQNPSFFLSHRHEANIKELYDFPLYSTPIEALEDNYSASVLGYYNAERFHALKIFIPLFFVNPDQFIKCLAKIKTVVLQHDAVIFPLLEYIYGQAPKTIDTLFRIVPNANFSSTIYKWNHSLLPLTIMYSHWQLICYSLEKDDSETIKKIIYSFEHFLPRRDDVQLLVLSFGGYLIHSLRNNLSWEQNCSNRFNEASQILLNTFIKLNSFASFCDLSEVFSVFNAETFEEAQRRCNEMQCTGKIALHDSNSLLTLLSCNILEVELSGRQQQQLVDIIVSSNNGYYTASPKNATFPPMAIYYLANIVLETENGISYWFNLRNTKLSQLFYQFRFNYLRGNQYFYKVPINLYIHTSVAIVKQAIMKNNFNGALQIFNNTWNDLSNMLILSYINTDYEVLIPMQYLIVYKVLFISKPTNTWDNTALLDDLPELYDAKHICIDCLKKNIEDDFKAELKNNEFSLFELLYPEM